MSGDKPLDGAEEREEVRGQLHVSCAAARQHKVAETAGEHGVEFDGVAVYPPVFAESVPPARRDVRNPGGVGRVRCKVVIVTFNL